MQEKLETRGLEVRLEAAKQPRKPGRRAALARPRARAVGDLSATASNRP